MTFLAKAYTYMVLGGGITLGALIGYFARGVVEKYRKAKKGN